MTSPSSKHPAPCQLLGTDGNIFNVMATASRCLKQANRRDEAETMRARVMSSPSYDAALAVVLEYVTGVLPDNDSGDDDVATVEKG